MPFLHSYIPCYIVCPAEWRMRSVVQELGSMSRGGNWGLEENTTQTKKSFGNSAVSRPRGLGGLPAAPC